MEFYEVFGDLLDSTLKVISINEEELDEHGTPIPVDVKKGTYKCHVELNNGNIDDTTPNSKVTIAARIFTGPDIAINKNELIDVDGVIYKAHLVNKIYNDHTEIDVVHESEV